jgi:hypothetical protein
MGSIDISKGLVEARYYETYHFANLIANILEDPFPYIRKLDDFYGDLATYTFLEPFPKYSYFHRFVEFLIEDQIYERLSEFHLDQARENAERYRDLASEEGLNHTKPPIERAFDYHGIEHQSFRHWLQERGIAFENATDDHLYDYYGELRLTGDYDKLLDAMVEETFFIMFLNRRP